MCSSRRSARAAESPVGEESVVFHVESGEEAGGNKVKAVQRIAVSDVSMHTIAAMFAGQADLRTIKPVHRLMLPLEHGVLPFSFVLGLVFALCSRRVVYALLSSEGLKPSGRPVGLGCPARPQQTR